MPLKVIKLENKIENIEKKLDKLNDNVCDLICVLKKALVPDQSVDFASQSVEDSSEVKGAMLN